MWQASAMETFSMDKGGIKVLGQSFPELAFDLRGYKSAGASAAALDDGLWGVKATALGRVGVADVEVAWRHGVEVGDNGEDVAEETLSLRVANEHLRIYTELGFEPAEATPTTPACPGGLGSGPANVTVSLEGADVITFGTAGMVRCGREPV